MSLSHPTFAISCRRLTWFLPVVAFCLGGGALLAAEPPLPSPSLLAAVAGEVSGDRAWNYTARISQFDRIQASEGWHDAAAWIKAELERVGYTDATIEGWPSNGSTRYFTYKTPIGWRGRSGTLRLVSPRAEKLASFEELPLTLIKHSASGHVEAELVDVGTGVGEESYRGKDVRGKLVLATGAPGAVAQAAVVERGAVGMIGWYTPDTRPGYPTMVRYTAFWPTWEQRGRQGIGFNVSKQQGWMLKQMLDEGRRVVLQADVEAEFYETQVETLTVSLPGAEEPSKELLIVGHLCHPTPSANDNASGSGGMLEMARALKRLVDTGAIPRPRRTIRFLWVPEFAGTVPYIKAHLERTRNTLAVINCDMIGEDLAKTGGLFTITQTPESLPTYLNDVAIHFARLVEGLGLKAAGGTDNAFAWRAAPYSGGSDHLIFNDGSLRVPALMFGHGDIFHHTSLDTMDKVDASELRRVCTIALSTMVYLAGASDPEARDMARLVTRNGMGRVAADYHDAMAGIAPGSGPDGEAFARLENELAHAAWRETEAVRSTQAFAGEAGARAEIGELAASIERFATLLRGEAARRVAAPKPGRANGRRAVAAAPGDPLGRVVPVRALDFICPLDASYLDEKLGPGAGRQTGLRGEQAYEALNFVDGKRSVADIARAVSASVSPVTAEDAHAYFRLLERAGLLSLR
ncbi:MAG TPA: DUF4910 domain-containing protein [Vicinamibacterales bacterium]|nr:DUF4910 domain-containing protein [Vicinamibacterales bacterium]